MFNATVVGRVYNGKVFKGKGDNKDRKIFRGRLNYRDRAGEYQFIDAVCFRDFGDTNGLVGFLEKHFSAEGTDDNKGGQGVIVVGHVRPTKKKTTIQIKGKKNGKACTVDKEVEYETFEFVIEEATFPPTSSGTSNSVSDEIDDDEFEIDDDDIDEDDAIDTDEDEEEEEEAPVKKKSKKGATSRKTKASSKKQEVDDEDDDEFFDE